MKCPICQTETTKEYCPNCAWEFEYYFDELDPKSKAIYEERFRVYKAIYEKSILEPKYTEKIKIIVQEKKGVFSKLFGGDSIDYSNIIAIDGLMYQNQPFIKRYTWEEAKKYAKNLRLGGYDDWRLPTRAELQKLLIRESSKNSKDDTQYIRKEFIKNIPKYSWFWTSEEKDSSYAWDVYFYNGDERWHFKTLQRYSLCVR